MSKENEFTLVLYGLSRDGEAVRGEVFARKLSILIKALREADRHVNGGKRHILLIDDLKKGSASVTLKEHVSSRKRTVGTGCMALGRAFSSLYHGGANTSSVPDKLVTLAADLASGAEDKFSHGEAIYEGGNVIRIDKFFISQAELARKRAMEDAARMEDDRYEGDAKDTFDGVLKVVDSRGQLLKAILTLTAGGREIECVIRRDLHKKALTAFDARVIVEGTAIYARSDLLPARIDVDDIRAVDASANLLRWRGKFSVPHDFDEDLWTDGVA